MSLEKMLADQENNDAILRAARPCCRGAKLNLNVDGQTKAKTVTCDRCGKRLYP